MQCPNCQFTLSPVQLGDIEVDHCTYCGVTVFEANEVNRITLKDAERLALMKEADTISGTEKRSPRDGSVFQRMTGPSIPQHVTLLQSEKTGEVCAFADDLVEFKKAQTAKIDYFRAWRIPLPNLQEVLVYGFFLIMTVSTIYAATLLHSPVETTINAQELCKGGIERIQQKSDMLVSCTTSAGLTCRVEAQCESTIQHPEVTRLGNSHFSTLSDNCTHVRFICGDNKANVRSEWEEL